MDKQVIEKIEQLVIDRQIVEVNGREYTPGNLKPVIFNPLASSIKVLSLSGFCDFVSNDIDKLGIGEKYFIHVVSPSRVDLVSALKGEDLKREILLTAEIDEELETFPFERFMTQEEFVSSSAQCSSHVKVMIPNMFLHSRGSFRVVLRLMLRTMALPRTSESRKAFRAFSRLQKPRNRSFSSLHSEHSAISHSQRVSSCFAFG
jgi:hypothetical protein